MGDVKAIFFDIDGTLMEMQKGIDDIPEAAKQEIRRIQQLGHKVFIASGRPSCFISKQLLSFGFDGFVLCNGAHVKIDDQEFKVPLDQEMLIRLIERLKQNEFQYIIQTSTYGYIKENCTDMFAFYDKCNINYDDIKTDFVLEEILPDTMKLEVWIKDDEEKVGRVVGEEFAYDCHGTGSTFEVYSKSVSKANGIKKVLEYLQIDNKDSYAFGDGTNDLQMFETVGTAIAMGNAEEIVKQHADLVTDRIENDGVAKMLKKLF